MALTPDELKNQLASQKEKQRSSQFQKSTVSSAAADQTSQRYVNVYNDMVQDPIKYYDAFGGNVSKYKSELSFYEYMGTAKQYDLPEQYTRYADRYDDMRLYPQKYVDALGGESAYKSELNRVKELYGMEKTATSEVISKVSNRVKSSFLEESGLSDYYQYDETNAEDQLLQELGYAPSSFYTVSELQKKQEKGYDAAKFYTDDENGAILSKLYSYDETDPEDVLNAALGIAPKSFKYDTSDEDKAREREGLLPVAAETYIDNSKQFAEEYADYAVKMQDYVDKKNAYSKLFFSFTGIDAPVKPEMPESVQVYSQYETTMKNAVQYAEEFSGQDFYSKTGETEIDVDVPYFSFDDNMPVDEADFSPSASRSTAKAAVSTFANTISEMSQDPEKSATVTQDIVSQYQQKKAAEEYDKTLGDTVIKYIKWTGVDQGELKPYEDLYTKIYGTAPTADDMAQLSDRLSTSLSTASSDLPERGAFVQQREKDDQFLSEAKVLLQEITAKNQERAAQEGESASVVGTAVGNAADLSGLITGAESAGSYIMQGVGLIPDILTGSNLQGYWQNWREYNAEKENIQEQLERLKLESTEGYESWMGVASDIGAGIAEVGADLMIGQIAGAINAIFGGVTASGGTALTNPAISKGVIDTIMPNATLKVMFVENFGNSLNRFEEKGNEAAPVLALLESSVLTYIEGMGGIAGEEGIISKGLAKLPANKAAAFAKKWATTSIEELGEESAQSLVSGAIDAATGTPFLQSDSIQQWTDPTQLLSMGISVAVMSGIFGLNGLNINTDAATQAYMDGDFQRAAQIVSEQISEVQESTVQDSEKAQMQMVWERLDAFLQSYAQPDALDQFSEKYMGGAFTEIGKKQTAFMDNYLGKSSYTTLSEQIESTPELLEMASSQSATAQLITQNSVPLTDIQVQVLRDMQSMSDANPYVNVVYDQATTSETLQKEVAKYVEKSQSADAELKTLQDTVMADIEDAYKISAEAGKAKYTQYTNSGTIKQIMKLMKSAALYEQRLSDTKSKRDGYNAQQGLRQIFASVGTQAPDSQSTALTATEGQTQAQGTTAPENLVPTRSDRAVAMNATVDGVIGSLEPLSNRLSKAEDEGSGIIAEVLTSNKQIAQPLGERVKEAAKFFQRKITDTGIDVYDIGNLTKDNVLYPLYNNAKQSKFSGQEMIGGKAFDIYGREVGKGIKEIFAPIRARGDEYTKIAFERMLHLHNIDRMTLVERGFGDTNKPVFGESVTADDSRARVAEIDAQYPELAQYDDDVRLYTDNLMQWLVDSRRITQESADLMKEMYPNYVPTYRYQGGNKDAGYVSGRTIKQADAIKSAKGSSLPILPIDESMARKTLQTVASARMGILGLRLFDTAMNNPKVMSKYMSVLSVENDKYDLANEEDAPVDAANTIKIYMDGEVATMQVTDGVFEAFKDLTYSHAEYKKYLGFVTTINSTFKKLVTGLNPAFALKNFFRDLSDAGLNTRDMAGFMANYPLALAEIASNGQYWQLYKRFGGIGSSFFDYQKGVKGYEKESFGKKAALALPRVIESVNVTIEQAPRLAEFMSTIKKGDGSYNSTVQAMYDAAEVTVNFGRSGSLGKVINRTAVPFFNPSVQGASRLIRRFTETKGVKEWTTLVIRAALLGVSMTLLNNLLYSDDEEYAIINDRDKDRYYLFKMGDGNWAKIPKGRIMSLFGGIANRLTGQVEDEDFAKFINLAQEQVAPINPFESNIVSPILAVENNRTWYDTPIEGESLQKYAPGQRYDESTDAFSKWLGGVTNYSPKKINYLIDAFTGVIGDVLLPATTPKAEKDPFTAAFTLDTKTTNKLSTEFYDLVDNITYDINSGDPAKVAKAKADNKIVQKYVTDISELNKLVRTAQNSDKPDAEKLELVRNLKATIGGLQKSALDILKPN